MRSLHPGKHRIEALVEALDHPERRVPAIHITGSNGKTSTARITGSLLEAAGLSVGTFTSPHLQSVRERIALNGTPIDEAAFGELFDHIRPYVELVETRLGERLSYFELLTGMFYLWAAEHPVDALVVEVGLGGRWDATNVVDAPVAVITNIGLEHTDLLGTDRTTIAAEKSGIVKVNATLVTAERDPSVLKVLSQAAGDVEAQMSVLGRDFDIKENLVAFGGRYLSLASSRRTYDGLFLSLHGSHQVDNAATAVEAVTRFLPAHELEQDLIAQGLANVYLPGRLEHVPNEDGPTLLLDVAHNPDGVSALVSSLTEAFSFNGIDFVIGVLRDKDVGGMMAELSRVECTVTATEAKSERSVPADEVRATAENAGLTAQAIDDVAKAVEHAVGTSAPGRLVCVTGSHYVVGEARTYLMGGN